MTPHYQVTEWYADSIPMSDIRISVRQPLRHVGMGQMMALDLDLLKQIAAKVIIRNMVLADDSIM